MKFSNSYTDGKKSDMGNIKTAHRWLEKLRGCAGDTLVETLAAILIVALSSVLLLSAAAAAANINKQIKAADAAYSAEVSAAESMSDAGAGSAGVTGTAVTGKLTITPDGGAAKTVNIRYFGLDGGRLLSYEKPD